MRTWQQIEKFPRARMCGIGVLGYFPTLNCVQDMVWMGGQWRSWSGLTALCEKPSHWRTMPGPPKSEEIVRADRDAWDERLPK